MKTATLLLLTALSLTEALKIPNFRASVDAAPAIMPDQQAALSQSQSPSQTSTTPMLSDIMPLSKKISIFASFTRAVSSVSSRLDSSSQNTTILAPLNSAISDLPRKPWEDPEEYSMYGAERAYAGPDGDQRAQDNLKRFVESHVLPVSPWTAGEKVKTLAGNEVWFEEGDKGVRRVMPGRVEVVEIGRTVGNGEIWVLKGVLNYPRNPA